MSKDHEVVVFGPERRAECLMPKVWWSGKPNEEGHRGECFPGFAFLVIFYFWPY